MASTIDHPARIDRGEWVICNDPKFETSLPNLFVAGEVTGIGGGTQSIIECRLGGLTPLKKLELAPNHAGRRKRPPDAAWATAGGASVAVSSPIF